MRGLRLAIGHQSRVGKDTMAEYIANCYPNVYLFKFSQHVYEIHDFIHTTVQQPAHKDPILLQDLAEYCKVRYGEIWVKLTMDEIQGLISVNPSANIIVTDLRSVTEWNALADLGFTTVKIMRKDRTIDRDPSHVSETALSQYDFNYTIHNDSTISDFEESINIVLQNIFH